MKTKAICSSYHKLFPLSTQKGSDCYGINHQKMKLMAERGHQLSQEELFRILEKHHDFLAAGGAGGEWQSLQVGDIVIGFYDWETLKEGEQAIFERMNCSKVDFSRLEFPFANFCGVFGLKTNFTASNLSHSFFTDATLENANFEEAYLKSVDFSRSKLKGASFVNANLSGADFENCDLREADFTGAKIDTARFPGAKLKGVKY